MTREQRIEKLLADAKFYVDSTERDLGGQHCGTIIFPLVMEIEDLGLKISVSYYKSRFYNKELAISLMTSALNTILQKDY